MKPATFGDPPIGWLLQDDPVSTRRGVHLEAGEHRLKYRPGFPPLHFPNGHPTQNPEEEKKAEVSLCYLASGPSF